MILNVDRSTPEHAVHSTGSVGGGGGQRGTGHGGPKGRFRARSKRRTRLIAAVYAVYMYGFSPPPSEGTRGGRGLGGC